MHLYKKKTRIVFITLCFIIRPVLYCKHGYNASVFIKIAKWFRFAVCVRRVHIFASVGRAAKNTVCVSFIYETIVNACVKNICVFGMKLLSFWGGGLEVENCVIQTENVVCLFFNRILNESKDAKTAWRLRSLRSLRKPVILCNGLQELVKVCRNQWRLT